MLFQDLIEQIEDTAENREPAFVDNIDSFVRRAEQRIYRTARLPATRQRTTVSLTSGTATASWPSGFLLPLSANVEVAGVRQVLLIKDVSYLAQAYPDESVTGTPRVYANLDELLLVVAPTPDANLTMNLDYLGFPNSIVDDGESWLGDNAEEALFYGSMVEAYTFLKGEPDVMAMYEKKFIESVGMLVQDGQAADQDENLGTTVV